MSFVPTPPLAEINALAGTNGCNVVSLFAGCGGSSLGYRWAGYKVLAALEFLPEAADSYRANFPGTPVLVEDVRNVTGATLMDFANIVSGELDVLDGSPPCKAFSTGALREKGWGKEKKYSEKVHQRVDDLFFEYARLLKDLQPKVFVAENVKGLVSGKAQGYYMLFHQALSDAGYVVENRVICAEQLGVPQSRNRLIIQGVRKDLAAKGFRPSFPRPTHSKWFDDPNKMDPRLLPPATILEAFAGLPQPVYGAEPRECHWYEPANKTYQAWDKADIFNTSGMLKMAYQKLWGSNSRFHWFRQRPDRPSVTLCATVPCLLHWKECRTYTIPEVKRLQSFPDDFTLTGTYEQAYERVGRSVPPLLMKLVAERVRDGILIPLKATP